MPGAPDTPDLGRLDQLVPPPWPASRRWLLAVVVLLVIAAVVTLVISGVAGPRLAHDDHWGGGVNVDASDPDRLAVERIVALRNDGWVPVTIESFEPTDLDDISWGGDDGLPVTLQPGQTREIVVHLEVAGCDIHAGGYDVYPFRARSGLAPARVVEVDAPHSTNPTTRTTYQTNDGDVTVPAWPDQPPSWILDAIAAPCQDEPAPWPTADTGGR